MTNRHCLRCLLLLSAALLAAPVATADSPARPGRWSADDIARGREQLLRAFDSAWIRVIAAGRDQAILDQEPPSHPGAAHGYILRLADCLPQPQLARWPEKPVGPFRDILDRGVIRQLVQAVPETPANTSWYFSGVARKYQAAVIDEIAKHYGVDLRVESVSMPPGPLPATSLLVDGRVDFISQLNATGGQTQGMRRRISRRFSCTMSASSQFIHIPEQSKLAGEIHSLNDLIARPGVRICAGPLATQTARAYLPGHTVKTKYVNDLSACDQAVRKGELDVIINPLPDLAIAGINGYRSVPTLLVTGTPLWVALEGIQCTPGKGRRDPGRCFETDPP